MACSKDAPMSPILDLQAIAARIGGLLAGQTGDVTEAATRLGVGAEALRKSIDRQFPHPSLDVLVAVVRHFGVDPAWLLYGEYDTFTHSLSADRGDTLTPVDLLALGESPRFVKADEPPEQRLRAQLDS
jgi:hypothetical protein